MRQNGVQSPRPHGPALIAVLTVFDFSPLHIVSFHGNLATSTPAAKGAVKARVLVLNGADDSFVTAGSIADFEKEMTLAGARYQLVSYPGAKHGFTNLDADRLGRDNNLSIGYNAQADEESWAAMRLLFQELFHP